MFTLEWSKTFWKQKIKKKNKIFVVFMNKKKLFVMWNSDSSDYKSGNENQI